MTFNDFWCRNEVNTIWLVGVGQGLQDGMEITNNTETDCDEDYCDLSELINESQFDFLDDLEGEVIDDQWCWNGEGEPRYLTNSITNVKAY